MRHGPAPPGLLTLALALALAGACSGEPRRGGVPGADSGVPGDAGARDATAPPPPRDAGGAPDGGDATAPPADTGAGPVDTGLPPTDSGTPASGDGTVGSACRNADECTAPMDAECFVSGVVSFPGGYCTKLCDTDAECGAGAGCTPLPPDGGGLLTWCARRCATDGDCRAAAGYECISGFCAAR